MGIKLNTWIVYYYNNDAQFRLIKDNLFYHEAIKLWQWYNTNESQVRANYKSR